MALLDALLEWEDRWRRAGAPVDELLNPGLSEEQVRAAIDFAPVHPDVVTWFKWRNGSRATFGAAPSGRALWQLDWLIRERSEVKAVLELGLDPEWAWDWEDFEHHEEWDAWPFKESYLPLLGGDRTQDAFMDMETGVMYRLQRIDELIEAYPAPVLQIGEDLESLVRTWIEVWDLLPPVPYVPGYAFQAPLEHRLLIPEDLRLRGVCNH